LEEIRGRVDRTSRANDQQRRSRLAMLVVVDIARRDFDAALNSLDRLFSLVQSSEHSEFSDRWPEMLAAWAAVQHPETHDVAGEMVDHLIVRDVRSTYPSGNEAWPFQIVALMGLTTYFDLKTDDASIERFGLAPALKQWAPANDATARSRGTGRPPSHWQLMPGSVDNLAGHGDDSLYFQSPLRGNYAVECDVTAYGWRDSYLSVAGTWVVPVSTLTSYRLGGVRGDRPRRSIKPKLTKPKEWHRLRTVVRDGVSTTYVNGRKIHEEPLPKDHVPWLAIRSFMRANGITRNLRITGNPVIPDRLKLSALADLNGWMPYFGESIGQPRANWQQSGDLPNGGGIVGGLSQDHPGTNEESLLRYHRPMLEDGTIEYEFYYRAGQSHTHPALDRLAFMLDPRGVRVHWITDGKFDRTGLDPANVFDEPKNRRGPDQLPLRPDAWNRLRLTLKGDTVRLMLNGQLVYVRKLEPANQRTFGLFHYADRTEARVRNVVWHGDWPRNLPSIADQELAGEGADFLDAKLPELTAGFHHDFAKDGLPLDRFSILRGELSEDIIPEPDGVHIERPGGKGYHNATFSPMLKVEGDFDITVSFERLKTNAAEDGSSSLILMTIMDNEDANECLLYRRQVRRPGREDAQVVVTSIVARKPDGTRRETVVTEPVESTSGTMRLARRGDKVYYLFADGDSPVFRLIGSETIADDDLQMNGVRLITQTKGPGSTSVVWKNISIRGEKLTGLAMLNASQFVAELDEQRDALADRFDHDFARDDPSPERLHQWGHRRPLLRDTDGLRVMAPGSDKWVSTGLAPQISLSGDFDVSVSLDVLKMDKPATGQNSAIYLNVEFDDKAKSSANVILVQQPDGRKEAYAQMKSLGYDGKYTYSRMNTMPVKSISAMRIARRGKRVSLLFAENGSSEYRVLNQTDIGEFKVPKMFVRLMVHTGGAGRETLVLLKHFRIHAEEINALTEADTVVIGQLTSQLTGDLPAVAMEFDGKTQYVTIPSIRYDGSHPITLEVFATPDNLQGIVIGDTQRSGVDLGITGQRYNFHAWNGKGYDSARSENAATRFLRVHLAGTFDGKTLKLFVNGKLMKTNQLKGKFTGSGFPMTIGASPSPLGIGIDFPFDGVIDGARISRIVRYTKDFVPPARLESDKDTLAVYRFDEADGITVADSSGNKHHGQIRGAQWVTDIAIRHRAAVGLAKFGRHAVGVLTKALSHKNPDVRIEAALALGTIGPHAKPAKPALELAASDRDQRVSNAANAALKRIE
jgi:hypothetical protein